jgi:hypothetical protein
MQNLLLALSLVFFFAAADAQDAANIWRTLGMVQVEKEFDPTIGMEIIRPDFGPLIEKLNGREVTVRGYVIPLTGKRKQSQFLFSAYPYSQCFFCGQAGPETAMEVFLKEGESATYQEEAVLIKGIMRLRSTGDINGLFYSLHEAEVLQ